MWLHKRQHFCDSPGGWTMIDVFFALLAAAMSGGSPSTTQAQTGASVVDQQVLVQSTSAAPNGANMAVIPGGLVADPQTPSGKFTTAAEVKPILNATKGNWVAVRDFNGQDLLYVSHLWAWRCGLKALAISVNGEQMQNWPLPACHDQFTTPNAVLEGDGVPYLSLKRGSVATVTIQIVYDDLSIDVARFERGNILIP
jgi:hypothetical protein